ncbi:MAG: nucleotidyl transferase AbiEii/AbiGii toxin family protein, partial [Acidobacteria bacterium]|nr:nucleotidyl transferase AbiEii/AbiGii toxin family protein [Acidobacteriota bacterium]
MHEKALPPGSRKLLDSLKRLSRPVLRGWTLAGGTGLALRVGHRLSDDFDFFRTDDMDRRGLHDALSALGEI